MKFVRKPKKKYVLITVRSPRFLTALLFLRANLRSFVGREDYKTTVFMMFSFEWCFALRCPKFICSYMYTKLKQSKKKKREMCGREYIQKIFVLNVESFILINLIRSVISI